MGVNFIKASITLPAERRDFMTIQCTLFVKARGNHIHFSQTT